MMRVKSEARVWGGWESGTHSTEILSRVGPANPVPTTLACLEQGEDRNWRKKGSRKQRASSWDKIPSRANT